MVLDRRSPSWGQKGRLLDERPYGQYFSSQQGLQTRVEASFQKLSTSCVVAVRLRNQATP